MSSELEKRRREHYLRSKAAVVDPQFEISLEKLKTLESNWHSARQQTNVEKNGSGLSEAGAFSQTLGAKLNNGQSGAISNRIQPNFQGTVQSERVLNTFGIEESAHPNPHGHKNHEELLKGSMQSWKSPPVPRVILNSPNTQGRSLKESLRLGPEFGLIASARVGSPKHEHLLPEHKAEVASARLFDGNRPDPGRPAAAGEKLDIQRAFEELEAFKSKLHGAANKGITSTAPKPPEKHDSSLRSPKIQSKLSKPQFSSLASPKHPGIHPASSPSPKAKGLSSPIPKKHPPPVLANMQTQTPTASTTAPQPTVPRPEPKKTHTPVQPTKLPPSPRKKDPKDTKESDKSLKDSEKVHKDSGKTGKETNKVTTTVASLPLKEARANAKQKVLVLSNKTGTENSAETLQQRGKSIWKRFEQDLQHLQASTGTNVSTDTLQAAFSQFMAAVVRQAPAEER